LNSFSDIGIKSALITDHYSLYIVFICNINKLHHVKSEKLHQEARDATDLANKFDQDNIAINDSAAADLRDAAQKAEAMAQERDQAVQAVEDADRDAASLFE